MTKLRVAMATLFVLSFSNFHCKAASPADSLLVMFWNLENFFDYRNPPPQGTSPGRVWNARRFYRKCEGVAKTILYAADRYGRNPDIIGVAEIDDAFVLRQLVGQTALRKLGYRYVHFDSPDRRGIDCGLLYREETVGKPTRSFPSHILDSTGHLIRTRDILTVQFDSLSVLVNHHPSKLGSGGGENRSAAWRCMQNLVDSLQRSHHPRVLCVGDFNDELWDSDTHGGTIRFEGHWEKIDGCFLYGPGDALQQTLEAPFLLTQDKAYGGLKPLRTFSGPRYLGGISDHLPVVIILRLSISGKL